jgi:hypothetical protein
MAVRTNQAGVKHKRLVNPRSAQPSQGATGSRRKTLPLDAANALGRLSSAVRMRLGPAAKRSEYARGRIPPTVAGRKKPPSQMKVKRRGGPFTSTRLHGG